MSVGSGIAGSFGFAPEVTYGTYVAPTRWVETSNPDLKKVKTTYQGGAMAAGRLARPGSMRVVTSRAAGGTVPLEVFNKWMGNLLNGLMGGTVAPVQQGGTPAYLQTHALADPTGRFYTMQTGVPDANGTVRPYTFLGSKIIAAEFSCGINEALTVTLTIDSRDVSEAQSLAAPSYATGVRVFHFAQSAVKLGTYGAEVQVDGVKKMTVKIERASAVERFYQGNAGLKSEPIINDYARVTGTVEADYLDKTVFADRFAADSSIALLWEFVGPQISGIYNETFRIKVPMIFFDGDTPILNGPDIVSGTFPWTSQLDGTNPLSTIEYISTDTTL